MSHAIRTARLRGLNTAWVAEGPEDKPFLFFIHGYPDTATSWAAQIDHFKQNFRVIAPFARGARPSESSDDTDRYNLDAAALDHLSILRIEDPEETRSVYVIGHDIGGAQAWHLAPMLGPRLKGLIIINSVPAQVLAERFLKQPSQLMRSSYMIPFMIPALATPLLRRFPGKFLQIVHNAGKLKPENRPRLAKALPGVVNPVRHYQAILKQTIFSRSSPRKVKCPVLVIWGEDEAFLNRIKRDELVRYAANIEIRVLRGGHWLYREDPDQVNQLVEEFVC